MRVSVEATEASKASQAKPKKKAQASLPACLPPCLPALAYQEFRRLGWGGVLLYFTALLLFAGARMSCIGIQAFGGEGGWWWMEV